MNRKEQQAQSVVLAYGEHWPLATLAAERGLSSRTVRHVVARAAPLFTPMRHAMRDDMPESADGALRAPCVEDEGGAP